MKLRSIVAGVALGLAGLVTVSSSALSQTKKFTFDADFDSGTLNNVRHNPINNQLILGRTAVSQTRLVWVDNTAPGGGGATPLSPGWIVRIDTTIGPNLGKQTARFDSVLTSINGQATGAPASGNNPGRVAVDTNGDVWIVNRAYYEGAKQGSLSKFSGSLAHCIDRNNNGVIDTSHDANGDGIIDPYKTPALGTPANQVEYYAQEDECILATIPVGAIGDIPRAVAVDRNGKIWAATHTGHRLYRFNPNEPVALEVSRLFTPAGSPSFPFTAWFYSAATADDYLYLTSNPGWSNVSGTGHIIRVNINDITQSDSVLCGGGAGTCGSVYGIVAIPGTHKAWAGGYSGTGVYKIDFDTNPPSCTCVAVPSQITAVTYDLNGKIWASGYNTGNVYRINPNTNVIEATCATGGSNPHGLSVDFDGFIWSVQDGVSHLARFDPNGVGPNCGRTNYVVDRGAVPMPPGQNAYAYGPYLYSDFTGVQIDRQAPYTYVGSWDGIYDGAVPNLAWSKVTWNTEPQGAVPGQTTLTVSARAANDLAALASVGFTPVVNNAAIPGVVGRYVQVRTDLKGPGYVTPVLSDISVTGPCPVLGQSCCVVDGDCSDGNVCTLDTCPVPGGACVHGPAPNCCLVAGDCNDQNPCTTDTCPVPGGACTFTPNANCCNSNAECGDNNLCTADICSGPGGTCSYPVINGCCNTDMDCTKGNACSGSTCPVPGGFCQGGPIPGCCAQDSDCLDNDLCTLDVCNVATKTCSNTAVQGCCNVDGDCDDNNTCTSDHCSGPGGTCLFTGIPGCCSPNDPMIGKECEVPMSPFDKAPCKPGHFECTNGVFQCVGAVKPGLEACNGVDDNCDGVIDSPPPCPVGTACIQGVCAKPCDPGEFACPGGLQCSNGYCVPTSCDEVVCPEGTSCFNGICLADGGMSTSSSSSSSGTTTSTTTGGGGAGGTMTGAGGGGGAGGASTTASASSSSGNVFGLATGGGGCRCALPGAVDDTPSRTGLALAALSLATLLRRRRDARRSASISKGDA